MVSVQAIVTLDQAREGRISSRNIQLSARSLNDMWRQDLNLPAFESTQQHLKLEAEIVISGGRGRWQELAEVDR